MVESIRLVGSHEIRVRLGGISRQRVYQLTGRANFPTPVADLRQGKVWLADAVESWIVDRRPHQVDLDDGEV
jgi:predicted DNA-binding transcriptional regulator AlpA